MKYFVSGAALALTALALSMTPAFADATIKVSLWDNASNPDLGKNLGMGIGTKMDMSKAPMGIKLDVAEVPAGKVTFDVTNDSKETIHEMIVAPLATKDSVPPFVDANNAVDEEAAGHLGEVSELNPGKSGSLTVEMKPGFYALFCNVPGHYGAGMWTIITVK